ncbi:MAG: FTR1 family protein [Campylobacteraceae bacterium]|nr:FTR1 family protein [Campylobacteraceae bacterium]
MEELIVTFRESLEAALVVGIIFSYLKKIGKTELKKFVFIGIFLGILGSIFGAVMFSLLVGGFTGKSEMIFEGVTMIMGAVLIVYLILWMANQKDTSRVIKQQVEVALESSRGLGLMFLVFISILREGVETTLFLNAIVSNQNSVSLLYASIGIIGGLGVGYSVYFGLKGMNLRYLFNISSMLLILFATGLFARGIHEFQEAGFIPTFVEHIWDVNYFVDENGFVGEFLKSLFGYNGNPSLVEVFVYISSLAIMIAIYNKKSTRLKVIRSS